MILYYCLSRKEIINIIKRKDKTSDGYYYFPDFNILNELKGNIVDVNYYYNRNIFKNKVYFTDYDINLYLSEKKIEDFDYDEYRAIYDKFYDIFKEFKILNLKDKIPNEENTIENLIDTYEYIIKIKYY